MLTDIRVLLYWGEKNGRIFEVHFKIVSNLVSRSLIRPYVSAENQIKTNPNDKSKFDLAKALDWKINFERKQQHVNFPFRSELVDVLCLILLQTNE